MSNEIYYLASIDGDITYTMDELRAGVGTDWSDDRDIQVHRKSDGEYVGKVDPYTGEFTEL